LNFFKSKKKEENYFVQTAPSKKITHPLEEFCNFPERLGVEFGLYLAMKESVPVIDAAISKVTRLVGGFKIECDDENTQRDLNSFLEKIKVNSCSVGAESFIRTYMNQMLTYGTAAGEIVLNSYGSGIEALYNAPLQNLVLKVESDVLKLSIYKKSNSELTPVRFPELVMISALNPEPGKVYGNSIMKGLPFFSGILLKIFNSIGINWERIGNARFIVTYKPPANTEINVKERAAQIAREWSRVMKNESPSDFVVVGDVEIKVIGADNQILDSKVPVRQILEQILTKLSVPPFLLGLSWSATETMSTQQADILISELDSYRRILTPVISKICKTWLLFKGCNTEHKVKWEFINLKDELRGANARLISAKAEEIVQKIETKNKNFREDV
jgi:hypothetical protein